MIVRRLGQLSDKDKTTFDERLTAWLPSRAVPTKRNWFLSLLGK